MMMMMMMMMMMKKKKKKKKKEKNFKKVWYFTAKWLVYKLLNMSITWEKGFGGPNLPCFFLFTYTVKIWKCFACSLLHLMLGLTV
jgi:hypothetical protein